MKPRKRHYRKSGTLIKVSWGRKIYFPKKNFKCYIGSWYPVNSSSYSRPEPPFLCFFGAAGKYTFSSKGSKNVPIKGLDDKTQITATFLVCATGSFLPIQLIYQGKSERCLPKFTFPSNFHVAFTPIHCEKLFKVIIFPYLSVKKKELGYPEDQHSLIIMDTFKGQDKEEMNGLSAKNDCEFVIVPHNLMNKF